jgi:type III secretion protein V
MPTAFGPNILKRVVPKRFSNLGTADVLLAMLVIVIVGLMIVPLPTWLLDILLATNISVSVGVLLVVLYVPDALHIATFPSVLLIATLFRLALNVSSTRLILLQANAGEVIRAFGSFVVRGNYVVGAVVFLILTIIQFIVIAKGSERVAEVGARFVLDAMPGKQMAIDAELRAGGIDGNEAKRRRRMLSRESQFYGAMDGAMKFVKGDVIASLIITGVNILGGLAIGVLQRGMAAEDSLKRYGLLTIGDGLVTQIPALVLSTAAGILVTRVASEEPETSLGDELASQLFGMPKALRVASAFVVLLALVPGLPAVPFLFIASLLVLVSHFRSKQLRAAATQEEHRVTSHKPQSGKKGPNFVPFVTPWCLDLSPCFRGLIDDELSGEEVVNRGLRSSLTSMRESFFDETGVPLPPPLLRLNESLPERAIVLSLYEIPARTIQVPAELENQDALDSIVDETHACMRSRASDFIGISETQMLLDQLEQIVPNLPRLVVPKPLSLTIMAEILRRLVEERVSIRDLRSILEALASAPPNEKDPLALTELVRGQLRRATSFALTAGAGGLGVFLLDNEIEETVRAAIQRTPSGSFLALAPASARDIQRSIYRVVSEAPQAPNAPLVLLTQPDIRRFVRKLIENELPDMWVVSFAELLPEISLRALGKATIMGV